MIPPDYPPVADPLPRPVFDSHCHLDIGAGGRDGESGLGVAEALAAASSAGVAGIVQVGVDVPSSRVSVDLAGAHPTVVAAVAVHPNEAPRIHREDGPAALESAWREISDLAAAPRVRAIGETGLDYFRTEPAGRVAQEDSFRAHIRLAKQHRKPLVIHDREAHADILRVVDDEGAPETVVMHCFSGDAAFAREVVERGWYCSFAGVITFKNAGSLRAALQVLPAQRILVETDAPFLTPAPHRGRPNASYVMPWTVRSMAEQRGMDLADFCDLLAANTRTVFGDFG